MSAMAMAALDCPIVIHPDCLHIGGDLVVGALYSQIVHGSHPRVHRKGLYWIAQTREQWMAESGLTLDQYKRAIGVLKRKGLVEVKVMRRQGLTISHLRALPPTGGGQTHQPEKILKPVFGADKSAMVSGWWHTHQRRASYKISNQCTEVKDSIISSGEDARPMDLFSTTRGKESGEIQAVGELEQSVGTGAAPERETLQPVSEKTTSYAGWLMKAQDILKQRLGPTNGSLEGYWKSRCALVHGTYQRKLTGKEVGQLKHLQQALGDQTRPVIDYVLNHWTRFASRAGIAAGVSHPADPNIGFLLKYHEVAVNLLISKVEVTMSPSPSMETPVQSVAAGTEDADVHTLTSQELTELLNGLKTP